MGVSCFHPSSSSHDENRGPSHSRHERVRVGRSPSSSRYEQPRLPNPDPSNYKIVKSRQIGEYLLMMINYPDCTNYEGNKILLFRGTELDRLLKQNAIDPHFCTNKKFQSPIARFEPTHFGWDCGIKLIKLLNEE